MNSPSEALKAALEQFCDPDDVVGKEGYSKLFERGRAFVDCLLQASGVSREDREDIVTDVMVRVWANRKQLTFAGPGKWWNFLSVLTRHSLSDFAKSQKKVVYWDDEAFAEIPDDKQEDAESLLVVLENRREVYRLADEVFLGMPSGLSERDRDRRLLAAKLMLVDKLPWRSVCTILNAGTSEEDEVTREILDEWLASRYVIRGFMVSELYRSNAKLCEYLLSPEAGGDSWSEVEKLAIIYRYRHAILIDQIEVLLAGKIKKSELSALFVRCVRRFPFLDIVKRLKRDLVRCGFAREELKSTGLWYRLILQYHSYDDLRQRDILDRTETAGTEAGFGVNEGQMNAWVSGKRLLKKMTDHFEGRDGNVISSSTR